MKKILFLVLVFTAACAAKQEPLATNNLARSTVYFSTDSSTVSRSYEGKFDSVIAYLKSSPHLSVLLKGYTDYRGSFKYNMDLGDYRARSVKAAFIRAGVQPDQIVTVSYGESKPISKTLRENRCVVIQDLRDNDDN